MLNGSLTHGDLVWGILAQVQAQVHSFDKNGLNYILKNFLKRKGPHTKPSFVKPPFNNNRKDSLRLMRRTPPWTMALAFLCHGQGSRQHACPSLEIMHG